MGLLERYLTIRVSEGALGSDFAFHFLQMGLYYHLIFLPSLIHSSSQIIHYL